MYRHEGGFQERYGMRTPRITEPPPLLDGEIRIR